MMVATPPKDAFSMYTQLKRSVTRYALHCESAGSFKQNKVVSFSAVYFFAEAINKLVRVIRKCEANRDYFIPAHDMNGLKKEMEFFTDKMKERIRAHCLAVIQKMMRSRRGVTRVPFRFLVYENEVLIYHPGYTFPCIKNSHVSENEGTPLSAVLVYDRNTDQFSLAIPAVDRDRVSKNEEQLLVHAIFRLMFDAKKNKTR